MGCFTEPSFVQSFSEATQTKMTRCLAILGKIEIDVPTPRFGSTDILEVGEDPFVSISGWKEWGVCDMGYPQQSGGTFC